MGIWKVIYRCVGGVWVDVVCRGAEGERATRSDRGSRIIRIRFIFEIIIRICFILEIVVGIWDRLIVVCVVVVVVRGIIIRVCIIRGIRMIVI